MPLNLAQLISAQRSHSRKGGGVDGRVTASSSSSRTLIHGDVEDESSSSELRAARRLVDLFVDVYQEAFVKMSTMRQELAANQQHIKRLKAELSDACSRGAVVGDLAASNDWNVTRKPLSKARLEGNCDRVYEDERDEGRVANGGMGSHERAPLTLRSRNFEPLDEDSENSLSYIRGGADGEFTTPVKSRQY